MAIKIIKCDCKGNPSHASEYQDKKYGQGQRICNVGQEKKDATCTVCGKTHNLK